MHHLFSILAVTPATVSWSPKVGLVMVACNIIAIVLGKYGIQQKNVGLELPAPGFFGGMSHGAMLACASLGHIIGVGAILGLATIGVL
ncbi:MAG: photosystem I reaction center subunit PsaK [Symploca sp. SIO2G7]|nr:photosystem I reaction center subunit PsaK [Symploca sp. SIO2G7]